MKYRIREAMETKEYSQAQRKWVREEVCLLVSEYFRTKAMSNAEIQKSHEFVSKVLRNREIVLTGTQITKTFRNVDGITMQSARIKCLDPDTPYSGMQGTRLQKDIVGEYLRNPAIIKAEAYDVIRKYGI